MHRSSTALLLCAALACSCGVARTDEAVPSVSSGVHVGVSGANLATYGVARVTVAVGPGGGSYFPTILAQLSPAAGSEWTAFLTGIPAGMGRTFDLVAYDGGGIALLRGGAQADVLPGATTGIAAVLQEMAPPGGPVTSTPVINFLSVSPAIVAPGGTALLMAAVGPAPAGEILSYWWQATCGTFADPTQLTAIWTAPSTADVRCLVTFTAATASTSTSVELSMSVQNRSAP